MAFTALFDACVLYPAAVRDLLLSLASVPASGSPSLFRVRWSERILDEWTRALTRDRPELAEQIVATRMLVEQAIADANVVDYERLIEALHLPDPNDRHVLAAAIVGRADVIVTLNLRHFPAEDLAPFGIEAQHPDQFIAHVLTLAPPVALAAVKALRARLRNPPMTAEAYIALLTRRGLPQSALLLAESVALI